MIVDEVERELEERSAAAYDADGVDRSLIRARLAKTPEQRLEELEGLVDAVRDARRLNEEGDGAVPTPSRDAD